MFSFKSFFAELSCKNLNKSFVRYVKRKYPLDPDHAEKLPVFEYKTSKENYRRVFAWGNIQTGALGFLKSENDLKNASDLRYPKRLSIGEKNEITNIACGFGFTLFGAKKDIFGTGINTDSQIGYHAIKSDHPLGIIYYPQLMDLPFKNKNTEVLKLSAGRAHTAILTDEGLYLLGNNNFGQCGRKVIEDEDYSKGNFINYIDKLEDEKIIDIECGQDHTLALTESGAVYSCGWGADGQTGLGHYNNSDVFNKVKGDIQDEKIIKLSCRSDFVLALSEKGQVFGWGNTEYSQITLPDDDQQVSNPTHIKMLDALGKIRCIATSGSFCAVVSENNQVFTWGYGLLGVGPNVEHSKVPIRIPDTLFGKNDFQPNSIVESVKCGVSHCAAVTNLGNLYIWGRNRNHCLGLGHDKDQYFPLKVSLSGFVQEIYCGIDHTIALCKPFI